jgi:maltooligosyltrehalose trehalohydrolase
VVANEEKDILVLTRAQGNKKVCCFMNFSKVPQEAALPKEVPDWSLLLDSAHPEWGGPMAALEKVPGGSKVLVQPEAILGYANTPPPK